MAGWKPAVLFVAVAVVVAVVFVPSSAVADSAGQHVSVSPAIVSIKDLSPGETAHFELTIHNQEARDHVFALSTFQPPERDMREGRAEFPDDSWISFCSQQIEVAAGSQACVTVTISVPSGMAWRGRDWETWLGVGGESGDFLATRFYVRVLVSTGAGPRRVLHKGMIVGIAVAAVLLGYGARHLVRREGGRSGR